MERIPALADHDAGPQDDDGQALLPVHFHQHVFGGRLGARIIVAAFDVAVERRVFRDRSRAAARVEGVDRASVDQPLDAPLQAGAGERAGRLDLHVRRTRPRSLSRMWRDGRRCSMPSRIAFEIGLGAHVRPHDLKSIAPEFLERRARTPGGRANGVALVEQLPDELPTDEAGSAKHEDGRLQPWGRLRSRSVRPGPSASPGR